MSVSVPSLLDAFDARIAVGAQPPLLEFNRVGVLSSADVHVAERIARLTGESDPEVMLAAALAVRGPRLGHVFVDLATIAATATVESEEPVDLSLLPWPAPADWVRAVADSALVAGGAGGRGRGGWRGRGGRPGGADGAGGRPERPAPLRLEGSRLYLDRYWQEERRVAEDLVALSDAAAPEVDLPALAAGLERLFPPGSDVRQRAAAAAAVIRRLAVVGGGPGTGKTTTVARIVALLGEQAAALGAPSAGRARGADREGGGPARRRRSTPRPRRSTRARRSARCCSACAPRRCIACSVGGPGATAGSPTIARIACHTTS